MIRVLLIIVFLSVISCDKNRVQNSEKLDRDSPTILEGEAYGSTFRIVYYGYGNNLNEGIQSIMNEFDRSVNTYKDDSFLSNFNNSDKGGKADRMLMDLVRFAKEFNIKTDGYFDPSVASLSDLWGFSKENINEIPKKKEIDSVLQFTGLSHVTVYSDSLAKDDTRFKLNFNSVTGYVNDEIANFLNKNKIDNYLIEIGGEVFAKGNKVDGTPWTIGIDEPIENSNERKIVAAIHLENEGLATSGNYRKFHLDKTTGEKIVHTINPKTGEAKPSKLLSATVIAPNTAEADAMATALMAMGLDSAIDFLNHNNHIKAYLIWLDLNEAYMKQSFNGFGVHYTHE